MRDFLVSNSGIEILFKSAGMISIIFKYQLSSENECAVVH
jgi:hypothetical protein